MTMPEIQVSYISVNDIIYITKYETLLRCCFNIFPWVSHYKIPRTTHLSRREVIPGANVSEEGDDGWDDGHGGGHGHADALHVWGFLQQPSLATPDLCSGGLVMTMRYILPGFGITGVSNDILTSEHQHLHAFIHTTICFVIFSLLFLCSNKWLATWDCRRKTLFPRVHLDEFDAGQEFIHHAHSVICHSHRPAPQVRHYSRYTGLELRFTHTWMDTSLNNVMINCKDIV